METISKLIKNTELTPEEVLKLIDVLIKKTEKVISNITINTKFIYDTVRFHVSDDKQYQKGYDNIIQKLHSSDDVEYIVVNEKITSDVVFTVEIKKNWISS